MMNEKLEGEAMVQAMEIVTKARDINRLSVLELAEELFDDFIEFHGDRNVRDDSAIVGGIASFNGTPVTLIGNQKGKNIQENIERNFGSPHPEGYRKAYRLMKQAEKFGRPVLTFVNTSGAYCGVEAEERGQGEAIARNLLLMSQLKVPVISFIMGEGGSGGALALAVANDVWMMENAIYSILSPEGFASILWKDASRAKEAAEVMKLTAKDLKELKVIDGIISETNSQGETSKEEAMKQIEKKLTETLPVLLQKSPETLVLERYERFRKF